ncbi:FAD-binding oxidoreductase [Cupriavidus sp. MP-37]|uniref:NAD(P)/FAD-dependent oxidoreductase n=1 Tax=Cupriavidus sp. MP-37 TaxID=2884455 RepID=UPI001D0AB17C|nr:FAD-dependent oxidoreductase [Cupriavidus sp. MP-37]UDM49165.1 FAD-dependent oxidoreductase [Cupriavidus sp. MP-37]
MHSNPHLPAPSVPSYTSPGRIVVVGAGIVGLCTALWLQRAGCKVTIYDTLAPGGGASYGNAGLISVDSCVPIALPGMAWQLPRWLLDPSGPLAIHPPHLVRAAPWLLAWWRASNRGRVIQASRALAALHAPALQAYRELLGPDECDQLIRAGGQLHLWSASNGRSRTDRFVDELRRQQGVMYESLSAAQIRTMMPGLASHVRGGIRFPRHAHTVDPLQLTGALAARFEREGGRILQRRILKLQPDGTGFRLWSNLGDDRAERVVVAAGAFSGELLRPLGIRLPLEAERGYHVQLPDPGVTVPYPFIYKDKAVAVTPMDGGLRFAGTVEIAGLRHPPDERRAETILATARSLFPGIATSGARRWFGLRPSTPDSVPIIDESPAHPGLYIATGHGHTGLTGAPVTGRLITHLMTGGTAPIDPRPYRLARFC